MARLGDIATVITKGTTPMSVGFEFCDSGINFVKIESISEDGSFIPSKFAHISEECNKKLARSQLKENDILFSIAGAIGRCTIVSKDILPANTNQALAIIRVPERIIDYKYLLYSLSSPNLVKQFEKQKQGVAQLNLSLQNVGDFIVSIKPNKEQFHIVSVLDTLNNLISLRKQQLAKLDELVKARFVEMFGDIVETVPLSYYILALSAGKSLAGEKECANKVLKTGAATYDEFDPGQVKNLPIDYIPQTEHLLRTGDVIISRMNTAELVGAAAYVWEAPANTYLPDRLWRAELKNSVCPIFIWQSLVQITTKESIRKIASGTSGSMKNISKPGLLGIQIKKVEIDIQQQFSDFVGQVHGQKLTIQQSLDKLETLKKSLMQEYFM